jgi:hypothetical protein
MFFRSIILGSIVGVVTILIAVGIIFFFYILGVSKGLRPATPKSGFEERAIAMGAAAFIACGFSAATIKYSKLRERVGASKTSGKIVAYAISFLVAFLAWALSFYYMGDKEPVTAGVIFGLFSTGIAWVLLEKIEKFMK